MIDRVQFPCWSANVISSRWRTVTEFPSNGYMASIRGVCWTRRARNGSESTAPWNALSLNMMMTMIMTQADWILLLTVEKYLWKMANRRSGKDESLRLPCYRLLQTFLIMPSRVFAVRSWRVSVESTSSSAPVTRPRRWHCTAPRAVSMDVRQ